MICVLGSGQHHGLPTLPEVIELLDGQDVLLRVDLLTAAGVDPHFLDER